MSRPSPARRVLCHHDLNHTPLVTRKNEDRVAIVCSFLLLLFLFLGLFVAFSAASDLSEAPSATETCNV